MNAHITRRRALTSALAIAGAGEVILQLDGLPAPSCASGSGGGHDAG